MRSMNLQIALSRTTAGVALVSALALGQWCQPAAAAPGSQATQAKPTAKCKF
jgi:Flp pilus assembly protein CpaB